LDGGDPGLLNGQHNLKSFQVFEESGQNSRCLCIEKTYGLHSIILGHHPGSNVNNGYGNDTIYGGAGNDVIGADAGDDVLSGDDGIALGASSASTLEYNYLAYNGTNIDLDSPTGNTIYDNVADYASGVGIRLDENSTGNSVTYNSVTYNTMLNNGQFDAEDLSTGSGTAGTANTWLHNTEHHDNHGGGLGH
jgi:Periplasmic copper-binding protein (NosD)/RTX calcium-binding nonapeptide repeat (4 copies)